MPWSHQKQPAAYRQHLIDTVQATLTAQAQLPGQPQTQESLSFLVLLAAKFPGDFAVVVRQLIR
jgi:hypothetical protein